MGTRLVEFNFTPGENQQIEAVINVPEEKRCIIHGTVKDHKNRIARDAVVKLFEVEDLHNKNSLRQVAVGFTDESGQFVFGPLAECKNYAIKVWINNVKVKELIIKADDVPEEKHADCVDVTCEPDPESGDHATQRPDDHGYCLDDE